MNDDAIPRVTFTDPELAHVGLTEAQARERHGDIRVLRWPYHENDRAQAERETRGHIKVVTDTQGADPRRHHRRRGGRRADHHLDAGRQPAASISAPWPELWCLIRPWRRSENARQSPISRPV